MILKSIDFLFRVMSSVVTFGAQVICNRIPGLTIKQKEMCKGSPDVLIAVGDGVQLGLSECQHQFRNQRWNCSAVGDSNVFGHVVVLGKKFQRNLFI